MDVRDFYKSRKGRDKEFQQFWNTSDNKQGKALQAALNKLSIIISEGYSLDVVRAYRPKGI